MAERTINLSGKAAHGARVGASALQQILGLLLEGSRRALRMRAEGRSTARGALPAWIARSTAFDVELRKGSTLVVAHTPTLGQADPEQFRQLSFIAGLDPSLTAIDYFAKSLDSALRSDTNEPWAYDRSMLQELRRALKGVFDEGIESLNVSGEDGSSHVSVSRTDLPLLTTLERRIPPARAVRIAGKLDTIRHSDVTFTLHVGDPAQTLRGVFDRQHADRVKGLWGNDVVVEGIAHFMNDGRVQLIEAEKIDGASSEQVALWAALPRPLEAVEGTAGVSAMRVAQGPRTGINALFGSWPGSESEEEVEKALEALS